MKPNQFREKIDKEILNSTHHSNLEYTLDLHGRSPEQARDSVNRHLNLANEMQVNSFRFVTGRGNHINSKGERGTLYREFPNWLTTDTLSKIKSIQKYDGYYEISIRANKEKDPLNLISEQFIKNHIEQIKKSAQKGDPEDQCILGHCYEHGIAITQDFEEAAKWYKKSAAVNNPYAQHALGGCYWQGKGVRQNDQRAIELFEKAAAQDCVWALNQLGDIYRYGYGVKQDLVRSTNYFQKASDLGLGNAKRRLAHAYYFGYGVQKDEKKAILLYKEVADKGDPHSAYNVGCAYFKGEGVEKNLDLAFKYTKQAADDHDPDAQYLLSEFYRQGLGTTKNPSLSYDYLRRSANNNFKIALFDLAFHPNTKEAETVDYLIKAAKANHIVAQAMVLQFSAELLPATERASIAKSFWKQEDEVIFAIRDNQLKYTVIDAYIKIKDLTKKQKTKIIRLLHILAEQEEPQANFRLGMSYYHGELGKKDIQKAMHYWQQGAKFNNSKCLCSLGYYYYEKAQTDESAYKDAFFYHEKAANRCSADSSNVLGLLYKNGKGIQKNIAKAIEYFYQAMYLDRDDRMLLQKDGLMYDPVFQNAAYNLAALYFKGDEGFPANEEKALYWLTVSAENGYEVAQKALQQWGMPKPKVLYQEFQSISFWKPLPKSGTKIIDPKAILKSFTESLGLQVDWQLPNSDKAWGYIDASAASTLENDSIKPFVLRETTNKKFILLLENISNYDLDEITQTVLERIETTASLQASQKELTFTKKAIL